MIHRVGQRHPRPTYGRSSERILPHPDAKELTMSEKDNSVPLSSFEIEGQARIKRSLVIQALCAAPCARLQNGSVISSCEAPGWRVA